MFNVQNAAYCSACHAMPSSGLLHHDQRRCVPMSVIVSRGCAEPHREACVVNRGGFARAFRSLDYNALEDFAAAGYNGRSYPLPMHVVQPQPFALFKTKDSVKGAGVQQKR